MAYMRSAPPVVQQSNLWWCWAACLEILNRAHPNKFAPPVRTQAQWVEAMQQSPVATTALNPQGGLNVRYLPQVFQALGMRGHSWAGPPSNAPDAAFIEDKLHSSYVMACYQVSGGSHFVIIYGVDNARVYYFNPWTNAGRQTATHQQIAASPLIIGWFA